MGQKALSRWDRSREKARLRKLHFDRHLRETDDFYDDDDFDAPKLKERTLANFRRQRLDHLSSKKFEWSEAAG